MKKLILTFLLTLNFSFSAEIPEYYGGQIISLEEFQQYQDYCFYTESFILEGVYAMGDESELDFNYRLYSMDMGQMVLGFGEFILRCYTEQEAVSVYGNTSVMNGKYNRTLKRGRTDRCGGLDWFDGYWYIYGCIPDTGQWYVIENSVGGTTYNSTGAYDCYDPNEEQYYSGSSYLNLVINKTKIFGVNYDDNFYYRTFACVKNEENIAINPTLVQLKTGLSTSRTSSDIGSSTGGGSGDTGGSAETTEKLEAIKTNLEEIKTQTSSTQTEFLGKIADVKNSILIQNENIAVTKADLEAKLNNLESKTENLENQIKSKIELENTNLKAELLSDNELKSNEIKTTINNLNTQLQDLENSNSQDMQNLQDMIDLYNIEDIEGRNNILNQLNSLDTKIDSISTGNSDTSNNNELIAEMNQGITKIDTTLNNGLIGENDTPYLKSINESINNQNTPLDDNNEASTEINDIIGNELSNSISKYNNLLGFTNYCSAPSNITVSLMGQNLTLIDFSLLDNHISMIRTLFLSLAYILGLFIFLRVK